MEKRRFGQTDYQVTPVCVGTSALGNFPAQYGYEVDDATAVATILKVLEGPLNFIDTSNEYGNGGDSERRIGEALQQAGGLPPGFVLATKVDPLPGSTDFSARRTRESVMESLDRLGQTQLQVCYLHDPEKISFEAGIAPDGPLQAMIAMKKEGLIRHLGVAGGPIDLMLAYIRTGEFDAVISHNRYTLVDQSAEPLIQECAQRGIAFVNAAPYGGGILAKGPDKVAKYCYAPAEARVLDLVRSMDAVCTAHGVPLAAAALQFSLRDPRVTSTIVGMSEPKRIAQTLALASHPIPDDVWQQLTALMGRA